MTNAATLAAVKRHCRVDHNDDDALLTSYCDAAALYLEGAGVACSDSPLYLLALQCIVAGWYDGEEFSSGVSVGTRQIIAQLKMAAEDGGVG